MTAVRSRQHRVDETAIQGGRAVRAASPWREMALQSNHLRGRGAMLIPMHAPNRSISEGNNRKWNFRTTVRDASKAAVWIVSLQASGTSSAATANVNSTSVGLTSDEVTTVRLRSAADSAAAEVDAALTVSATHNSVVVLALGLMEEHRAQLDETDRDQGVDLDKLRPGDPIQAVNSGSENYTRRLAEALSTSETGRRVGLICQGTDDSTTSAYSTSSSSWTELIGDTPAFMRGLDLDDSTQAPPTEANAAFRVRAHVSGGATAAVRLQTTEGASTTITGISGASFAWYPSTGSDPETISIQTEDLSTSDGKRGGNFDHVSVDGKITSGTGTLSVSSVCVWEDEVT